MQPKTVQVRYYVNRMFMQILAYIGINRDPLQTKSIFANIKKWLLPYSKTHKTSIEIVSENSNNHNRISIEVH